MIKKNLTLHLTKPTHLIVFSDTHLFESNTTQSNWFEQVFAERLASYDSEPAILVLNGDIFEFWQHLNSTAANVLKAHPGFLSAIKKFLQKPQHKVYFLVGNHDNKVAWSKSDQRSIESDLGAKVGLSLELQTSSGVIHLEHGHQFDKFNRVSNQLDPNLQPFGKKLVQKIIPALQAVFPPAFLGIEDLVERDMIASFVFSRSLYRFFLPWVALPATLAFLALAVWQKDLAYLWSGLTVELIFLLVGYTLFGLLALGIKLAGASGQQALEQPSLNFLRKSDYQGIIVGHTHLPSLAKQNNQFFADSGCCDNIQQPVQSRFWPKVFVAGHHLSWLEASLTKSHAEIKLWQALHRGEPPTRLESLLINRLPSYTEPKQVDILAIHHGRH